MLIDALGAVVIMRVMKNDPLASFEKMVKRLVEGAAGRLFREPRLARQVATDLARMVEEHAATGNLPTHYRVALHPDDIAVLSGPDNLLAAHLADYLQDLARQAGHPFAGKPVVEVKADGTVALEAVRVETVQIENHTLAAPGPGLAIPEGVEQLDAFLIVNGRRHIPLDKPRLTIGRRMDNDIVVDSLAVSRKHAQVRWRYGRFVLYDAGSRAGLRVNGQPAHEWVLRPGDVITLVDDVTLIYGEGAEERDLGWDRSGLGDQETLALTQE